MVPIVTNVDNFSNMRFGSENSELSDSRSAPVPASTIDKH